MTMPKTWLEALTLNKLHRLAGSIGSPCSGTKPIRVQGIREAISSAKKCKQDQLSLLSIDMGIRNLAFAHFTAKPASETSHLYDLPKLQAWHRVAVSRAPNELKASLGPDIVGDSTSEMRTAKDLLDNDKKESFEPSDYAGHAYNLVNHLLQTYKPNYVLIERQRFRSGGRAAVPEWTIRVGVFEGMLHAVLRTLVESGKIKLVVESMLPTQVNRYWFDDPDRAKPAGEKLTGRDGKRAKIDLVGNILEGQSSSARVVIAEGLQPLAQQFVSVWKKEVRTKKGESKGISKLDDLADSFLQGLAWINWQNNRQRLDALGAEAVILDLGLLR
jgi:cruciform cutting endonuclease 1